MNRITIGKGTQNKIDQNNGRTGTASRLRFIVALGVAFLVGAGTIIYTAFADTPPVLRITSLGSNQFNIVITNGVPTNSYTLFWTPFLEDENYPWEVLGFGATGETNFTIDAEGWDTGFFRVMIGDDSDLDGIPDWQDAAPLDPNIGQLQVIIYTPANGSTINN